MNAKILSPHSSASAINPTELQKLDRKALVARYTALYARSPPKNASTKFLRGNVARGSEAQQAGRDPIAHSAQLIKLLETEIERQAGSPALSPGTRLIREWRGIVHEVAVTGAAFVWRQGSYKSLTAVAYAITGQKRSGPRFFGLKDPKR